MTIKQKIAQLSDEDLTFEHFCWLGELLDCIGDQYPTRRARLIVKTIQNEGLKRGLITKKMSKQQPTC